MKASDGSFALSEALLATDAMADQKLPSRHRAIAVSVQQRVSRPLIVVIAAKVDPSQSIRCPGSAPAAVVGGIGNGCANEREAAEAMMEAVIPETKVAIMEAVVPETGV
jgi:hypothetical protein